jgi:aminoglycoside phosphotransferase (APT) family kinase protein
VVAAELPGLEIAEVRPLGAGWDNVAYEVNGELVVRFRRAHPADVEREAQLLRLMAAVSPLPVPQPLIVDPVRGCLGYRRLPGVPVLDLPGADPVSLGEVLGGFLQALHAVPYAEVAGLVPVEDDPPVRWLEEAGVTWRRVSAYAPPVRVDAFLTTPAPRPAGRLVFSHNDLGIEHVLADPATGAVTGVLDWSDAAICDPAYDLGLILRDLGPDALAAALRILGRDEAELRERALFYARCTVIEDLAYGVDTGQDAYVSKSQRGLRHLF